MPLGGAGTRGLRRGASDEAKGSLFARARAGHARVWPPRKGAGMAARPAPRPISDSLKVREEGCGAGHPGQLEQEYNLRYVIETRAKETLILANLEDFE